MDRQSRPRTKEPVMSDLRPQPGDRCLSIRQPWMWLIFAGGKILENRTWKTHYRGPLWLHAAAAAPPTDYRPGPARYGGRRLVLPERAELVRGALLGRVV